MSIGLDFFVNKRSVLTGVEMISDMSFLGAKYGNSNGCVFILDGLAYAAVEDPDDGYRSSLGSIIAVSNDVVKNRFPGVTVIGQASNSENDLVTFLDINSDRPVLEIGTDRSDGYYPCFVANFRPENMLVNVDERWGTW